MPREIRPLEDLRGELLDRRSTVRRRACRDLARHKSEAVPPGLAEELGRVFEQEKVAGIRRELAQLIVRFAPAHTAVSGLCEELALGWDKARTRNDRFAALVSLRLAAEKGWDLTPALGALQDAATSDFGLS